MRIVLVGPPGAGKGTQAEAISATLSVPHISTGEIFRANIREGTPLGVQAKEYLDAGDLVPDEVTNAMIKDRLAQQDTANGFLLDGFPRTLRQAEALEKICRETDHALDAVIELSVDAEELVRRLHARRDQDGRSDDSEQTIRHRQEVYLKQTAPLVDFYRERGLLVTVPAMGAIGEVTDRITSALAAHRAG